MQVMTTNELMALIVHPEAVGSQFASELKSLIEKYPYFYQARLLWLKSLQKSESIHFESEVPATALYASDQRWLYFYLYPERYINQETQLREAKFSGSYFDLLDAAEAEGGDAKLTLRMIAERLKASRAMLVNTEKTEDKDKPAKKIEVDPSKIIVPVIDYFKYDATANPITLEEKSKLLIKEKKYKEAIEILNQLNLINPKKSIYFADQIRFLEKIIANSK
jgi:hypothetical protein